jgi:phage head maturation protease
VRRILEADLWEISIVTFPMLPSARVSNVKNARWFRDRETELVRTMRRAARMMKR